MRAPLPIAPPAAPGAPAPSDPTRPDLGAGDLPALLVAFYAAGRAEPLLAPYFAPLDLSTHVPRVARFWDTVLFGAASYDGNAFAPHQALAGLTAAHFARWAAVLAATVDARHAGPVAEQMKVVGRRVARGMGLRLGVGDAAAAACRMGAPVGAPAGAAALAGAGR